MPTEVRNAALNLRGAGGMGLAVPFEGHLPPQPQQASLPPKYMLVVFLIWVTILCVFAVIIPLLR